MYLYHIIQRISSKGGIGAITQTSLDLVYNDVKVKLLHRTTTTTTTTTTTCICTTTITNDI